METSNSRRLVVTFLAALAASLLSARAEIPAGYQEFLITGTEVQMFSVYDDMENPAPSLGMHCVISVAAGTNPTKLYYDHWENGFTFNVNNPSNTADEVVTLLAGGVRAFESSNIPIAPRGTNIYYDGGDRIHVIGGGVTVARASWSESNSTLQAEAWELYPVIAATNRYVIPVGEDLALAPKYYQDFTNCFVLVMATRDNTTVAIDDPTTVGVDVVTNINAGRGAQLFHMKSGTTVTSSLPVAVLFFTGDPADNYEVRGYTAVPRAFWSSEYYVSVGSFSNASTDAFFYNPNSNTLAVAWQDATGTGTFNIAARDTLSYFDGTGHYLPIDRGAYVRATNVFWGIGSVDTESSAYDWGVSLIPPAYLKDEYVVGWAPSTLDRTAQGSPLFAMATEDNTTLYVDLSPADGNADLTYTLDRLEVQRIYDPDFDLTGTRVWSSRPITLVWGEDPEIAQPGYNFLDMGYTTLPFRSEWMDLVIGLTKTASPVVLPAATGQVSTFTLRVNSASHTVDAVTVVDTLPPGWGYVTNSTYITKADGSMVNPPTSNPTIASNVLTWGTALLGSMPTNRTITIQFQGITTAVPTNDVTYNNATATGYRYAAGSTQTFTAADSAYNVYSDLRIQKTATTTNAGPLKTGDRIDYTVVVTNPASSAVTQTGVVLIDNLPTATTFVPGSGRTVVRQPAATNFVADFFTAATYNNNDGTVNWASGWSESGDDGAATTGDATATNGEARIRNSTSLTRSVNLGGATNAVLAYTFREIGSLEFDDYFYVEISTNGTSWTALLTLADDFGGPFTSNQNISAYASAGTQIRFRTSGYADFGENLWFDNVSVTGRFPAVSTTNSAATPPTMISGVTLRPGAAIVATLAATVNSNIAQGSTQLVNCASTSSDRVPSIHSCTTNPVTPTLALIGATRAYADGGRVYFEWETASEAGTLGFQVSRLAADGERWDPVSGEMIPALVSSPQGAIYRVADAGARAGRRYAYRVEETELDGNRRFHGPFALTVAAAAPAAARPASGDPRATFQSRAKPEAAPAQAVAPSESGLLAAAAALGRTSWPSTRRARIVTAAAGLHFVGADAIAPALGLSAADVQQLVRRGALRLSRGGKATPWLPAADASGLYFLAQPGLNRYAKETTYWLAPGLGAQMARRGGAVPTSPAPGGAFASRVHAEEDRLAIPGVFQDPEADFWVWSSVAGGFAGMDRAAFAVRTEDVAPAGGSALLQAELVGASAADHAAVVRLNGVVVGEARWSGLGTHTASWPVNPSLLRSGDNQVEVQALPAAGPAYSLVAVDSFDLAYPRACRAAGDELAFRGGAAPRVTVGGFSGPQVLVFDTSEPGAPVQLAAVRVDAGAAGADVTVGTVPAGQYLAVGPTAVRAPARVERDDLSRLPDPANEADYLVLAPTSLLPAAARLAAHRQSQGLKTLVADVQDVFDDFGAGDPNPAAIRLFLAYASRLWRTGPKYVVLAGDGTYDYGDVLGRGDNLVPPMLVGTPSGLFASDNRLADFNGDAIPDIAIGRLPARTNAELDAMVSKIVAYEAAGGAWTRKVVLASDNADGGGDFAASSDGLAQQVAPGYDVQKIDLGMLGLDAARAKLLADWSAGAWLVNYVGHGGLDRLAQEGLLLTADVPALANGPRLPLLAAMTCVAGRFEVPGYRALGETLVAQSDGGAIACWAPSGLSLNTASAELNQGLFAALFRDGERRLGDAVWGALEWAVDHGAPAGFADSVILLGDPALDLR